MLPPSGEQKTKDVFVVRLQLTIFCHSKVSLPRCEPHTAARGSPWERLERVLEMMEILKGMNQISLLSKSCVSICIRNTISVSLHIYKEKAKFDLIVFFYFFSMIITFWPAETYLELHPLYNRFCATQIKL